MYIAILEFTVEIQAAETPSAYAYFVNKNNFVLTFSSSQINPDTDSVRLSFTLNVKNCELQLKSKIVAGVNQ